MSASRWVLAAAAGLATLAAASCMPPLPPMRSDTGYEGTWSRGNERGHSIVAVKRNGDRHLFRWTKVTYGEGGERKLDVRCDWEGNCRETLNGELQATYTFRTWLDDATGRLMVEGVEERVAPERFTNRFVDELVVEDEGMTLRRYTLERMGQTFTGEGRPMATFEKVADAIADPPGR